MASALWVKIHFISTPDLHRGLLSGLNGARPRAGLPRSALVSTRPHYSQHLASTRDHVQVTMPWTPNEKKNTNRVVITGIAMLGLNDARLFEELF